MDEKISWGLNNLPKEIKLELLQYLDVTSLVNLGMISRVWNKLANDNIELERLIRTHFPNYLEKSSATQNDSQLYKKAEIDTYQKHYALTYPGNLFYISFASHEVSLFRAAKCNNTPI